jgi:hypothetical protein
LSIFPEWEWEESSDERWAMSDEQPAQLLAFSSQLIAHSSRLSARAMFNVFRKRHDPIV